MKGRGEGEEGRRGEEKRRREEREKWNYINMDSIYYVYNSTQASPHSMARRDEGASDIAEASPARRLAPMQSSSLA